VLVWGCSAPAGTEATDGAAASSEPAAELPTVRVAINTWPGLGPYYVAQQKGFDREEGILLEVVMTENTEARRSSLLSGEVDLVGITLDTVVIARSRGVPMVVVGKSDISYGGDGILAKPAITTVADLAGKRVACPEGLPSHFFLLYLLRDEGLGPDDIELVPADDGGQAAFLFTSGEVDAAVTWDPWISNAEDLTDGHVLITTRDVPGLLLGIVAANANYLDERADRIAAALRAWFKAVAFTREHPQEAAEIMAGHYNVPIEDFQAMLAGAKLADLADTLETFGTEENPGPVYKLAEDASELWMAAGVIERPVAPSEVVSWVVVSLLRGDR
jgi:NitT/TauT family transport system substrate-binding protein